MKVNMKASTSMRKKLIDMPHILFTLFLYSCKDLQAPKFHFPKNDLLPCFWLEFIFPFVLG